jgi:hypothetical protein
MLRRRGFGGRGKLIGRIRDMDAGDVRFVRAAGIGMLAVGTLLLLGFGAILAQDLAWRARAVVVEARVTGLRDWPQEGGPSLVSAEFAFVLPDGTAARALGAAARRPCCRVGEVVRLAVDPARPAFVEPAGAATGGGTPAAMMALGLVFAALGTCGVLIARRGAREGKAARGG